MRTDRLAITAVLAFALAGTALAGCGKCGSDSVEKAACATAAASDKSCHGAAGQSVEAEINTAGLAALIRAGTPVVILDARSGKYDDGRRIPGAKSLSSDADAKAAEAVIKDKSSLVVTYCSNLQCPASGKLAAALKALGYSNVLEYSEGIEGWTKAGNSVEGEKK